MGLIEGFNEDILIFILAKSSNVNLEIFSILPCRKETPSRCGVV